MPLLTDLKFALRSLSRAKGLALTVVVTSLTAFGDFSTIEFTMVGLGDPRSVRAGVVGGSYFDVMGLRAVRGRRPGRHAWM